MEEKEELSKDGQRAIEIEFETNGFLNDATYSFYVHNILQEYKDKFPGAEKLLVSLFEIPYYQLGRPSSVKTIDISEDRKVVKINHGNNKYYNNKGKETGLPTPKDVFASLQYILNKAVNEYKTTNVDE